ncbi:MAG TPA: lytic murein transglycosylase [Candidatus Moranbacteria bacterium]|jgi:peptidoglycan hydrolase CwlO-like protein|nr:hypothetical protein [Candidatus Moranbacteria bacterium]HOF42702.1 lytic murein transglycosylase [Candidatus Moranbacteria bacterium]HPX94284.1 lytic murein transglycosylase [Candidatus Moranbacteria bacterium]HQB59735.1 lytic murein transglycosylase [Candidatus Moranbacteria bacterium]
MNNAQKNIMFAVVWALVLPVFALSQISFWNAGAFAADGDSAGDEEKEKKEEIEDTEDSIKDLEKKLEKEQKELQEKQSVLGQLQSAVSSTQSAINKTQAAIKDAEETISRKEEEIKNLNEQIELKKAMLKSFLQQIYYIKSQPVISIVLAGENFRDVFSNADNLMTLEDKIMNISQDIAETKNQVERDKIELAETKKQHEEILDEKVGQKKDLVVQQVNVQEEVEEQEATVSELQEKLAELQADLSILTGKSFNAKDIKEAVEFASKNTGVPKGVLYGFLKMETNLGANTGQCTYKEVEKVAVARYKKYGSKYKKSIKLLYKRMDIFYDLVDDLGYSKNKKVSCSPSSYIGQGGAMGVAQFMSDVWKGYSSRIAAKTGHKTPDPWDLTDGVTAMAIKLRDAGATSDSKSAIKKASINYLGAFNENYYNGIVYWSKNYKKLFD